MTETGLSSCPASSMIAQPIILIRDNDRPSDAAAEQVRGLLKRCPCLPDAHQWPVHHLTLSEAAGHPAVLDGDALAWIMVEQADAGELFEVISVVQEHHLPTLVTRRGETEAAGAMYQDGVVICPPGSRPEVVGPMVQSLRSQLPVLRAMKTELKLLRAHEGGLCDQIGRIDEELRLAAQLQREFLPKELVSIHDVGFRVLFRPASYVSGDIYDVIRLDEKHIGFFLADAVGHGVPAALLTMFIKRSLVTKKIDSTSPRGYRLTEPAEALEKLNRDLVETQGGQVRFATACYGVINCETHQVCVARAGHPFPLILRSDGSTQALEPEGGLLGVFPEETYEQSCFTLAQGERLLLYSDGFEMAFPGEGTAEGKAVSKRVASMQYAEEFEDLRVGTLDEALQRLERKLDSQSGSLNQRDDLTILCLGVESAAQSKPVESGISASAA